MYLPESSLQDFWTVLLWNINKAKSSSTFLLTFLVCRRGHCSVPMSHSIWECCPMTGHSYGPLGATLEFGEYQFIPPLWMLLTSIHLSLRKIYLCLGLLTPSNTHVRLDFSSDKIRVTALIGIPVYQDMGSWKTLVVHCSAVFLWKHILFHYSRKKKE